jgi:hypothetical protein
MVMFSGNNKKYGKDDRSFLSPQTFEFMLHQWPEWKRSIKLARELPVYGYPLPESYEERQKWINQQGGWAWQAAVKVMHELELPEHLWQYWLCCVHSNYETADGTIDYSKIVDFYGKQRMKVYPPLPYKVSIWGGRSSPGKFGPVSIEVHPKFAYRAVFEKAMSHARQVAEVFAEGKLHTILSSKQWAKGQSQLSQRKLEIKARFQSGQCSLEDILKEEASSFEVRKKIEEIIKKNKIEREIELRKLRRQVLARIHGWLSEFKPLPRVKKGWWPYDMPKDKGEHDM